eukprot:gene13296-15712_t
MTGARWLRQAANDWCAVAAGPGEEWMQHYEWVEPPGSPEKVRVLARSENFMHLHRGWRAVASRVHAVLAQCEGHDMALFKEKLNYKSPGGAGFRPHQDAAAYGKFASSHCTCMVAIDNADSANGGGTFDSCKVEDCELTEDMIATYQRQ